MAASSLGGLLSSKLPNFCSDVTTTKYCQLEASCGMKRTLIRQNSVRFAGLVHSRRSINAIIRSCSASSESARDLEDGSKEKSSIRESHIIPNYSEVQSLLTEVCDTASIAEFELKRGGFRLYITRNLKEKSTPLVSQNFLPVTTNTAEGAPDLNGSVATTSLALSKPKPSTEGIQRLLDSATDEGLVILQSPKVGHFRRSRTVKGKRAPPSCKEKQIVKEGQVLCYIEQLGCEIPVESDVSGEVIKILRKDEEPVGYGDALIAILPSFPGIKKLQ